MHVTTSLNQESLLTNRRRMQDGASEIAIDGLQSVRSKEVIQRFAASHVPQIS